MKFKIGDKVKIREDLVIDLAYGCDVFVSDMSEYCGKEAVITDIYDNCLKDGVYSLDIDDGAWYWTDKMLEDAVDIKKDHINLNSSDELIVTIQQGNKKIIITKDNIKFEEPSEFQKELTKILRGQGDITHLSEDEKAILKSIDKQYGWIARQRDGNLFLYEDKPIKIENFGNWINKKNTRLFSPFNHLFQFIKWEDDEPCNIDDLLEQKGVER